MFAIKTDHAAELSRHVDGSMTWSKYAVNLAWLGFADIHSEVNHYFVNVGSKYMGADLNSVRHFLRNVSLNICFYVYIFILIFLMILNCKLLLYEKWFDGIRKSAKISVFNKVCE